MESGSDRVLRLIKKDITISETINAVKQCGKYNIMPLGYFLIGIPGESLVEIKQTFSFMAQLQQMNPNVFFPTPGIFRPYPGGELYERCKQLGLNEPATLQGWTTKRFYYGYLEVDSLPWISNPKLLEDFRLYGSWLLTRGRGFTVTPLRKITEWRFRYDYWGLRFEPFLWKLILFIYRISTKFTVKKRQKGNVS